MFYQKNANDVSAELKVDVTSGLSSGEAKSRLEKNGPNALAEKEKKTRLQMFLAQLNEPMIYILMVAAVISVVLKEVSDAIIIMAVVLINGIVGMVQEGKAQDALESLKRLSAPKTIVKRDGKQMEIEAKDLVVGDVVVLEAGRQIPADIRLTFSTNLKIEESALTGESVPSEKDADFIAEGEVSLGDRINMAYMSTNVSYGRGEGIVVATGMDTEIGKIAAMINESGDEMTPLQKRLADLGKMFGVIAVILCVALFGIAVIQHRNIVEMLITAISLAVAAVPEGLPAVVTIVLALGVQRLVKVNTIVRRLPSVETLGAVSVVCSDKTGTLTQNKMTVVRAYTDGKMMEMTDLNYDENKVFIDGFVLCNDASVDGDERVGDPTEIALVDMGIALGVSKKRTEELQARVDELPFDSDRKMMTTVHTLGKNKISYTKGAFESIVRNCDNILESGHVRPFTHDDLKNIEEAIAKMSSDALRVLVLAIKYEDHEKFEQNLTFVGLVGMIDPPRAEVAPAVEEFKGAGVKTVMITGDHKDTAFAIAKELGIATDISQCMTGMELDEITPEELSDRIENLCVFARVSPEHKVMIVNAFKSKGHIVSMTGDGVNDAPSLKAADIGIAMGITGTDVAKSAADMVLTDDNFATIEKAIEEGRSIYANIKKSVHFLLSSNFGEIITMFLSILVGLAAPLKAIHILWVNLITDSLPGLALGVDENDKACMMKEQPRDPDESIFAHGGYLITIGYGVIVALITLCGFLFIPVTTLMASGEAISIANISGILSDAGTLARAQTYAFTILGLSQLFHAIGMRDVNKSVFKMNHTNNKMMILAFAVGFVLQILVTEVPFLVNVFGTAKLGMGEWVGLVLTAMVPLLVHEIVVMVKKISK
ncbi:MAG: cation-translocating P-type ATPase [Clostridia bacterium]|nr:cation-translocating P-type ATPase [Clostridia bacterium]